MFRFLLFLTVLLLRCIYLQRSRECYVLRIEGSKRNREPEGIEQKHIQLLLNNNLPWKASHSKIRKTGEKYFQERTSLLYKSCRYTEENDGSSFNKHNLQNYIVLGCF